MEIRVCRLQCTQIDACLASPCVQWKDRAEIRAPTHRGTGAADSRLRACRPRGSRIKRSPQQATRVVRAGFYRVNMLDTMLPGCTQRLVAIDKCRATIMPGPGAHAAQMARCGWASSSRPPGHRQGLRPWGSSVLGTSVAASRVQNPT